MTFKEYQNKSRKTALYTNIDKSVIGNHILYPTLGLAGETGEFVEKIKKIMRNKNGVFEEQDKDALKGELGDILWYIAQLATDLGLELEDVAESNLEKVLSRLERNTINSEGDNR
ncbi:MAG: nucleoside triphosphate pyrophosphohydrolase family protein [Candidatus Dojkabacteria bacterium]|nr:nucleoside triphosphate pyrophosphohydrolase family protein [Candidatus Dojkabacteria bacterium]